METPTITDTAVTLTDIERLYLKSLVRKHHAELVLGTGPVEPYRSELIALDQKLERLLS